MSLEEKAKALESKIALMDPVQRVAIEATRKSIVDQMVPLGVVGYLGLALAFIDLTPSEEDLKPKPGLKAVKKRGFEVEHDGESVALEQCCFCWRRTAYWYTPKDVACCPDCAKTHNRSEVPTKKAWMAAVDQRRREAGRG